MTDRDFLLAVLSDGRERSLTEILETSMRERGCGMTVHSRAADLRSPRYGSHDIRQRSERRGARVISFYRLVTGPVSYPTQKAEAATAPEASGGRDDQADPEQTCDGGHGQDVAPMGSADGARVEAAMPQHDGGGDPGSVPNAGQQLLLDVPVRGAYAEEAA